MAESAKDSCYYCKARYKSIFSELGLEETVAVEISKSCMMYKKGQLIFEEGAYPHGLYCINNGKIKVSQTGADGREQIIHLCKDGDVMGYRAILSGDKYSCSATAIEDSAICFIPTRVFTNLVEKNTTLASRIMRLFANDLKTAEKTITDIAHKSVKERLAQSILLLKESYGYEKDGQTINIAITREELASIVGTVRETVTRLLSELDKEKSIELTGKRIKILNAQKLINTANVAY